MLGANRRISGVTINKKEVWLRRSKRYYLVHNSGFNHIPSLDIEEMFSDGSAHAVAKIGILRKIAGLSGP
jgi:hypothetical protein